MEVLPLNLGLPVQLGKRASSPTCTGSLPADFRIIRRPMDLGTVAEQLASGQYCHYTQVVEHGE